MRFALHARKSPTPQFFSHVASGHAPRSGFANSFFPSSPSCPLRAPQNCTHVSSRTCALFSHVARQLRVKKVALPRTFSLHPKFALRIFNHLRTLSFALLYSQNGKTPVSNSLCTLWPKTP